MVDEPDASVHEYAQSVCAGVNDFLTYSDYEMAVSSVTTERDGRTRVTLTLVDPEETPPTEVSYASPDVEYEAIDGGTPVTFAYQGQRHIHIVSNPGEWDTFDVDDHVGEVIACALEDTR